jgi:putative transposase
MHSPAEHPQFITITVYEWQHLLKPDKYKQLVLDSLSFLVSEKRVKVYAFVMLSNHMHLIWQVLEPHKRSAVQRDFLKYVSQHIKFDLTKNHHQVLLHFEVNKKDRKYQFWKRNALSVDLYSEGVFERKLEYLPVRQAGIHMNPVKAGLCQLPEEYYFSSAAFYELNEKRFDFLSHHEGE